MTKIFSDAIFRVMIKVGEILRQARKRAGLNQGQVAQRAGLLQSGVSRVESGRVEPELSTLVRLADACGIEVRLDGERLKEDDA